MVLDLVEGVQTTFFPYTVLSSVERLKVKIHLLYLLILGKPLTQLIEIFFGVR